MPHRPTTYRHQQRSPLCLIVYFLAIVQVILAVLLREEWLAMWIFGPVSIILLVLATSFHFLNVEDDGDALLIQFGPIPLFRRCIQYANIKNAVVDRTTLIEGWGIHLSPRGGWVWNIWGRECVAISLRDGMLRVGTDDAENLARFIESRITVMTN